MTNQTKWAIGIGVGLVLLYFAYPKIASAAPAQVPAPTPPPPMPPAPSAVTPATPVTPSPVSTMPPTPTPMPAPTATSPTLPTATATTVTGGNPVFQGDTAATAQWVLPFSVTFSDGTVEGSGFVDFSRLGWRTSTQPDASTLTMMRSYLYTFIGKTKAQIAPLQDAE